MTLGILMNLWLLLHGGGGLLLLLLLFVVRCRDDDDGFTNAKLLHLPPLLLLSVMVDDFLLLAVSAIKLRMDIDTNWPLLLFVLRGRSSEEEAVTAGTNRVASIVDIFIASFALYWCRLLYYTKNAAVKKNASSVFSGDVFIALWAVHAWWWWCCHGTPTVVGKHEGRSNKSGKGKRRMMMMMM